MKLLVGGDPELFLWHKPTQRYISAEGIVPGTKERPERMKHGCVQRDGLALEFNLDPADSKAHFVDSVGNTLDSCRSLVGSEVELRAVPSVTFDEEYYDSLSSNSKQLGCTPDYNAWTYGRNPTPTPIPRFHSGGGHLTLGWTQGESTLPYQGHYDDCVQLVQRLDTYFSRFYHRWDTDQERQRLYGRPGCFRPKPFGVEYRTPSNAWVGKPELWPWIYDSCQWVFQHALDGKPFRARCQDQHSDLEDFFADSSYPRYPEH